ncbi:hypothetical protein PGTUg99_016921 [Puccinia graminis f. sp. tritici]|uniref:Uncharacterized protein n=1 Tax=Puccinia graminis f. sp. tritici TaxID=56615 RepID=A0A5B0RZJ7_PUCGR|nr:hypothetical protein PGTUg99_016921 [Puccinia graminis f. sp. tritici]
MEFLIHPPLTSSTAYNALEKNSQKSAPTVVPINHPSSIQDSALKTNESSQKSPT